MNESIEPQAPETLRKLVWLRRNWRKHWKLLSVCIVLAGAYFAWPILTSSITGGADSFRVSVSAVKPVSLFDDTVILSLNTSVPNSDTLEFGSIASWSRSESGPFLTLAEGPGPKYRRGQQYFLKLSSGDVWLVNVEDVTEKQLMLKFVRRG